MALPSDWTSPIQLPGLSPARPVRDGQIAGAIEVSDTVELAQRTPVEGVIVDRISVLLGLASRERPRRTPYAVRALALALDAGRIVAHEDLRAALPFASAAGEPVPYKYAAFLQESAVAVLPARGPRQSQWDVHHLWHSLHGMFWYRDLSRGDLYAGARLNEAACEAHWYHLEAMFAPRCAKHVVIDLSAVGSETFPDCRECELATTPGTAEDSGLLLRSGVRFWDSEVASVDLFRQTHRVLPNPMTGPVENWREAFAYTRWHHRRLREDSFAEWVERFLVEALDYHSDLDAYRDSIAARVLRLLTEPIVIDPRRARVRQMRTLLIDVASRLLMERPVDFRSGALRAIGETVVKLTPLARDDGRCDDSTLEAVGAEAWCALVELGDAGYGESLALGYDVGAILGAPPAVMVAMASKLGDRGLDRLARMLAERWPHTSRLAAQRAGDSRCLARLVAGSADFAPARRGLGDLVDESLRGVHSDLAALSRYESLSARRVDGLGEDLFALEADHIAAMGKDVRIALNPTLKVESFAGDLAALLADRPAITEASLVLHGSFGGRRLVTIDNRLGAVAEQLRRPRPLAALTAPSGLLEGDGENLARWLRAGLLIALAPAS